jgi:cell shape-determining protein MreC
MRRDRWFLYASIFLLAGFIIFNFFSGLKIKAYFSSTVNSEAELGRLRAENESLKAQIGLLSQFQKYLNQTAGSIPAFVYSRYPFNLKNEILISVGVNQGVEVGDTVLFRGLLLGKVKETKKSSSVVQTIFDSNFQTAVRAGGGVDSLLKGGDEPHLTLIPKNADLKQGDTVYSAAPGILYGVPVGQIYSYSPQLGEAFGEASLDLGYSISDIKAVEIVHP